MIAVLKMPMRAGYNLARMGIDRALSAALLWMKQGRPQAPMPSHRFGEMKNSGRGGTDIRGEGDRMSVYQDQYHLPAFDYGSYEKIKIEQDGPV